MKKIILGLAFLLAACADDNKVLVPSTEYVVVVPPGYMYECPEIRTMLPAEGAITDEDVAALIARMYGANMTCRQSLDAIRTFLEEAKETTERAES